MRLKGNIPTVTLCQLHVKKSEREWVTELYFAIKRLPQKEAKSDIRVPIN